MTPDWHEEAEKEFIAAAVYYEGKEEELGERFISQIEAAISRAIGDPEAPRKMASGWRKRRASDFPYAVIYRPVGQVLQIIAVAHLHRRPDYWKGRSN